MVRGIASRVKPWKGREQGNHNEGTRRQDGEKATRQGLLLGSERLTNVGEKTGVGRATLCKVRPGLVETELAVYRQTHFRGIAVFLTIVFPPAHRTEPHGVWSF